MLTVDINKTLVGSTHALTSADVTNFADVTAQLTTTPCAFSLRYNSINYTGNIAESADGLALLVAFTSPTNVALPAGLCLNVTCSAAAVTQDPVVCPNAAQTAAADTKLAVLGPDGCPVGFITLADIIAQVTSGLNIPTTLCDLIPGNQIPTGTLVAADRILTTQNGCDLKSVPQTAIRCP